MSVRRRGAGRSRFLEANPAALIDNVSAKLAAHEPMRYQRFRIVRTIVAESGQEAIG
jgi:hypothetical protein